MVEVVIFVFAGFLVAIVAILVVFGALLHQDAIADQKRRDAIIADIERGT